MHDEVMMCVGFLSNQRKGLFCQQRCERNEHYCSDDKDVRGIGGRGKYHTVLRSSWRNLETKISSSSEYLP
mgnify:CR=1 FL=1